MKYRPGQIDLDQTTVLENLAGMPVDDLPTIGLTYWYLLANLQRVANQCLLATTVLQLVTGRFFGIGAELVLLTLDVPNGRGGTTRYGNKSPHLDGQHFVGHVGLITDTGLLIDPTAGQFPRSALGTTGRSWAGSGPPRWGRPSTAVRGRWSVCRVGE